MIWLTLAALAAVAVARHRLVVVTVMGTSMVPTHHPGDRVLVLRTGHVRQGQVVVAKSPPSDEPGLVIKRIAATPGDEVPPSVRGVVAATVVPAGRLVLIGDAHSSVDSRVWGLVASENVVGVVVARLHQNPHGGSVAPWHT